MTFSTTSLVSSTFSKNELSKSSLGLGVEAQVAHALAERYDKRHKEVIAAHTNKWRSKMKEFCRAALEKVKEKSEEVESLTRTKQLLEEMMTKEKEKEKSLLESNINARADVLVLQREVAKIQTELSISHRTIGQYVAKIKQLEEAKSTTTVGTIAMKTAVLAGVLALGCWAWKRL